MCVSRKRGRHSQSDVEVILSTENVPKIYQKCVPDPHQGHPCCFIVVPLPSLVVPLPFDQPCWRVADPSGEPLKVCIICLWARLVRSSYQLGATWTQLGSNLDPTWTQLGTNSSQHVKINTKVTPKWSKSVYRATCSHQKIIKIHWENVYFQETRPS